MVFSVLIVSVSKLTCLLRDIRLQDQVITWMRKLRNFNCKKLQNMKVSVVITKWFHHIWIVDVIFNKDRHLLQLNVLPQNTIWWINNIKILEKHPQILAAYNDLNENIKDDFGDFGQKSVKSRHSIIRYKKRILE